MGRTGIVCSALISVRSTSERTKDALSCQSNCAYGCNETSLFEWLNIEMNARLQRLPLFLLTGVACQVRLYLIGLYTTQQHLQGVGSLDSASSLGSRNASRKGIEATSRGRLQQLSDLCLKLWCLHSACLSEYERQDAAL